MREGARYLHGARLPAAYHGRPAVDADWLRDRKCLVWLILGQIFQAALVGLLVLILIGLVKRRRREEAVLNMGSIRQHSYCAGGGTTATVSSDSSQVTTRWDTPQRRRAGTRSPEGRSLRPRNL